MEENKEFQPQKYLSYKGMGMESTFFGIPTIPFMILFLALMSTTYAGFALLTFPKMLIAPAFILLIMVSLFGLCSNDPKALKKGIWKLKGLCVRIFQNGSLVISFGKVIKSINRNSLNEYYNYQ